MISQDQIPETEIHDFRILSEEAYISYGGGIVEVKILHTAPYELKVTDEWITEFDTMVSGYCVTHKFLVDANSSWKERVANIAFCTDQMCIPYTITQEADPNAVEPEDPADRVWEGVIEEGWETKEFLHRPVAMRFTADWCGYCPMMATALDDAKEKLGGNLEVMSLHCSGGLQYSPLTSLERQYMIAGYPTGIIDGMTAVGNYQSSSYTASVAVEAVNYTESNFSTMTAVGWVSELKERKLKTSLSVYLKEPGTYKVTVLAVEDNIRAYQNGYGNNYKHNGVPRHVFTSISGDEYEASSANEVAQLVYSGKIPDKCNLDNMRLVVYVQRSMGDKSGLASGNYGGYFIDNSASAKLGESRDLDF
jgi:thiol-disulfide isomerase/thioredoxin